MTIRIQTGPLPPMTPEEAVWHEIEDATERLESEPASEAREIARRALRQIHDLLFFDEDEDAITATLERA